MPDVIVIAGKGGTGKTTISSLIVLSLASRSGAVLAVDADPNSNLSDALGLSGTGTIADIIEEVAHDPASVPQNMGKDAYIEYRIHRDISENDGFDLLVMGRPEGPGCYCYINNVLRNVMAKLTGEYRHVVIDNEAGLEHFSRKTTRAASELVVVSDETEVGLKSAKRIFELVEELGIAASRKFLVINRSLGISDLEKVRRVFAVDEVFVVPFDKDVMALSAQGAPVGSLPQDAPARRAVDALGEKIWPKK